MHVFQGVYIVLPYLPGELQHHAVLVLGHVVRVDGVAMMNQGNHTYTVVEGDVRRCEGAYWASAVGTILANFMTSLSFCILLPSLVNLLPF